MDFRNPPPTRAELESAIGNLRRKLAASPADEGAWAMLGELCMNLRLYDEARAAFERSGALSTRPEISGYHLALVDLLAGDVHRGWRGFDHRMQLKLKPEDYPEYARPKWNGEPLAENRFLILPEQGIGDTIQMVRFIPELRERSKGILIHCPKHLRRFIQPLALPGEIVDTPDIEADRYDLCMWAMSMPGALGPLSDEWLRSSVPYLAVSDDVRARWREKLAHLKGLKVGVVWNGNPDTGGDEIRSIPGPMMRRLAEVPGVQLVAMQFRDGRFPLPLEERGFIAYDASREVGPWDDLLGACAEIDVLVTIDGSAGHCAGAIGAPTWVLVPYGPDFRWRAEGDTSPWYPSHRVFRQREPGDWAEVLERVAAELGAMARAKGVAAESVAVPTPIAMPTPAFAPVLRTAGYNMVVKGRHGYFVCNPGDKIVGRSLARYGEYSETEVSLFARVVAPRDIVVDAGAHLGAFAVPLARIVGPTGRVHAFEALRPLYYSLCANAALNSLPQLECHNAVLGEGGRTMPVPDVQYDREFDFAGIDFHRFKEGYERPVEALDAVLDTKSLALIKIDVNGMEREVVQGARKLIAKFKPVLYVANGRPKYSPALVSELRSLGYRCYWHIVPLFHPDNFAGVAENIFGTLGSINMVCVPASRPVVGGLPEVRDGEPHPAGHG